MVKIQLKDTVNMFYSIKCYELQMFKDEKPQIKRKRMENSQRKRQFKQKMQKNIQEKYKILKKFCVL